MTLAPALSQLPEQFMAHHSNPHQAESSPVRWCEAGPRCPPGAVPPLFQPDHFAHGLILPVVSQTQDSERGFHGAGKVFQLGSGC